MAISEIISLIEIVRSLVSRKTALDKSYFEQFIQPTWKAFVNVHEDYMESFKEYADIISNEEYEIERLIARIGQDSIYTANLRNELYTLIEHLPSAQAKTKEEYLSDFIVSMIRYFYSGALDIGHVKDREILKLFWGHDVNVGRSESGISVYMSPEQIVRPSLVVYLSRRGNETNRTRAARFFDGFALDLQLKYKNVASNYNRLRTNLLT